jgi:predicted acyl esterase
MQREPPLAESSMSYDATPAGTGRALFDFTFEAPTELTGYMKLKIHVSTQDSDDVDVFVGLQKLDATGALVPFPFYAQFDDGPVALGWLRASHRALDAGKSTAWQPVHTHTHEQKVARDEIVALEIEIWPSGTSFAAGETLRLIVQGDDINRYSREIAPVYFRHEASRNRGRHVLHMGGAYGSHLLVPVIPDRS